MNSTEAYSKLRCNTHEDCTKVCAAMVDGQRLVIIKEYHGREHTLVLTKSQLLAMFDSKTE